MTYELMPDEEHGVQHRFLVAPREIVVDNDRLRRAGAALTSALTLARPKSASTLTPKYSAISGSIRISGQESPFSHLLTACALTPSCAASASCVRPFFAPQRGDRRSDNVLFHCMNLKKHFIRMNPE